jgi:atypical dual specificity phosphatase
MPPPHGFSWIDKPLLAGLAHPESEEDLEWLRKNGIEILMSLTEEPVRRDWVNNAGLLVVHEPMVDMEAPPLEQLNRCVATIERARANKMGVAVHCGAGLGRTGVVLAAYLIYKGASAREAIARVRKIRPGSIETSEQAEAVTEFARQKKEL